MITVIAVAIILVTLGLNLLLTHFGTSKLLLVDTSYEELYTLTDLMKEECAFIDELPGDDEVVITFCADPDTLIGSTVMRVVYFMSLEMQKQFDRVRVETVNVTYNPTAVSKYKPTSLSEILPTDVIISYGDRYRVASTNAFWTSSGGVIGSYFGEYKMASLIMSVTNINNPTAYFVIDHGESYYDVNDPSREGNVETAALYDMLTERGLNVATLNLSESDSVPSDCVLLIINNPKEDFAANEEDFNRFDYVSDTEKLDEYLIERNGSIMVAKDHKLSLPVFEEFLYEWGFDTSTAIVKDESSHLENENGDFTTLVAEYDSDENGYGQAIYGDFAALSSSPAMIFANSGYISCSWGENLGTNEPGTYDVARNYAPFFMTSPDAVAYEKNEHGEYVTPTKSGVLDLAAVTVRMEINNMTGKYKYAYVFCANSADFFTSEYLGNASYANYEIMSALTENIIRSDEYASMELGSTSKNSSNRAGKVLLDTKISATDTYDDAGNFVNHGLTTKATTVYTVIIIAIPAIIALFGLAVCIKRRFL